MLLSLPVHTYAAGEESPSHRIPFYQVFALPSSDCVSAPSIPYSTEKKNRFFSPYFSRKVRSFGQAFSPSEAMHRRIKLFYFIFDCHIHTNMVL